ncbi:MAG: Na+/H+ antiporter NhaC family protein [Halioglobus sp.]
MSTPSLLPAIILTMEQSKETQQAGFYLTQWAGCIPFAVMLLPTIILSINGVLSTGVMIASGVIGLMLGSLLAREKAAYWEVVTRSLADPTGLLLLSLLLVVGIYGKVLTSAQLPEGLVWLSHHVQGGPGVYALFIYVACSVLGTAMGTSLGTVVIMTPVLLPVAVSLGVDPVIACGAILSGAATGDHFAPVSDTTIISSSTQRYRYRKGSASIGEVVRSRMRYAIPAFIASSLLYLVVGSLTGNDPIAINASNGTQSSALGLIMLLPMLAVVVAAILGASVLEALTVGTLAGILMALGFDLLSWTDLFTVANGQPTGLLMTGALENVETAVMILLMMGCYGVMREFGLMDALLHGLKSSSGHSPRAAEASMFGVTWLVSFLLVGLVARVTVVAGPIVDEVGGAADIHPRRRANILDGVANSFSFIMPWHIWPLLMIMTVTPLVDVYPFLHVPSATDFLFSTFYPVIIWCVMLFAVVSGYGREFEPR